MIFGKRKQLEEPESRRAEKPKGEPALCTEVTGTRKEVEETIDEALILSTVGGAQGGQPPACADTEQLRTSFPVPQRQAPHC